MSRTNLTNSPRYVALNLLRRIIGRKQDVDLACAQETTFSVLPSRDRAFCKQLVMTSLRYHGTIQYILNERLTKKPPKNKQDVLLVLQLGIAEKLWLSTPDYAVVNSYVELTKALGLTPYAGLVNAVLKRVETKDLQTCDTLQHNLPKDWWHRWCEKYGEPTTREIISACQQEPTLDIVLKSPEALSKWTEILEAEPLKNLMLRRKKVGQVTELPGYSDGEWWIQDAAAALPLLLTDDLKGKRALDMCAAPGGKTAQLCAAGAKVTALEKHPRRMERLKENMKRLQMNPTLVQIDALQYEDSEEFDFILLDAPCTATGTLRRHPELIIRDTLKDLERLTILQAKLLEKAATIAKIGGKILYCTCSLEPEEGEMQVMSFLKKHPEFSVHIPTTAPKAWLTKEGFLRILPSYLPESGGIDGFFAAWLVKESS